MLFLVHNFKYLLKNESDLFRINGSHIKIKAVHRPGTV